MIAVIYGRHYRRHHHHRKCLIFILCGNSRRILRVPKNSHKQTHTNKHHACITLWNHHWGIHHTFKLTLISTLYFCIWFYLYSWREKNDIFFYQRLSSKYKKAFPGVVWPWRVSCGSPRRLYLDAAASSAIVPSLFCRLSKGFHHPIVATLTPAVGDRFPGPPFFTLSLLFPLIQPPSLQSAATCSLIHF